MQVEENLIQQEDVSPSTQETPLMPSETTPLMCAPCGFMAKSAFGLKIHSKKHNS